MRANQVEQLAPLAQLFVDAAPALLAAGDARASQVQASIAAATRRQSLRRSASAHRRERAAHQPQMRPAARASPAGSAHGVPATCARPCAAICSQARADLAEQAADFVEPLGLVGGVRLHEARAHVFVQRVEVGGDAAPPALKLRLLRSSSMIATARCSSCAFSAPPPCVIRPRAVGDALERAVHQHDDEAMRIRGRDARVHGRCCGRRRVLRHWAERPSRSAPNYVV